MNVSFIHRGGPGMASYRYRAESPARELGCSIGDISADVLVFAKPDQEELLSEAVPQRARGAQIVVDFCDDHFNRWAHYQGFLNTAHAVTCPTPMMAARIMAAGYMREVTVIPDPYEYPEAEPHCAGDSLLWFGHRGNMHSLLRIAKDIRYPLAVVSNAPGTLPWSRDAMLQHFASADIVLMPATAPYKSANRTVEAIRQGCFVVAEPHPSLNEIPGIWKGEIREGIEWAVKNPKQANERTTEAQEYVRNKYAPRSTANAWRSLLESVKSGSTLAAVRDYGLAGSTSTLSEATICATSEH